MREKLKALVSEYGPIAIGTYLVLFALVVGGFLVAVLVGWQGAGVAGTAGTIGGAWVFAKLTQPARIAATLLLTPLVAKLIRRRKAVAERDR